jgi:hypothetical protein
MVAWRYSEWDGTQEIPPLDPDDVLEALTDDLMNFGDLQHAMRNLLQRGMRDNTGNRLQGLRDLLQQLRQQRRNTLDRFNLSSVMDDIKHKLDELLEMERTTIDRRLQEALGDQPPSDDAAGQPQGGQQAPDGQQGEQQQAGQQQGHQRSGQQQGAHSQSGMQGQPSMSGGPSQQGGQSGEGGESQSGQQAGAGDQDQFAKMLENIANRKKNFLSNLPPDMPGAVKELQNYEFMDPEAQHKFNELMESL